MFCEAYFHFIIVGLLVLLSTTCFSHTKRVLAYQRYEQCGLGNFRCNSGQCIGEHNLCDGRADCDDESDESEEACLDIHCPKFIHRCSYGACVKSRAKCDGVRDCLDGSDEASCAPLATSTFTPSTTRRRPANSRPHLPVNCAVPNDPENGIYTIGGAAPDMYRTGDSVPSFSVLVTNCDPGYLISPTQTKYSVCADGIWTPLPPTCSRYAQTEDRVQCQCYCN